MGKQLIESATGVEAEVDDEPDELEEVEEAQYDE